MATVGDLVVQLKADSAQLRREMAAVTGPRGPLGALPGIAAGAAAAAGVAIAGMAAKGVTEFASLEKGMNEVFTLMPGLTEDAMSGMTQDVQDFAREMGVLPNDIVPALYQSISAGVPKDNVFDFLETANKTAIGGVAELDTSVRALASATNAYGPEVLDAADASDILFTAMKAGQTTVGELANSVSEVAPIAASLGIGFDETQAALAAMTSQGEPTKKAATKIRQAMAELSKDGSAAFKAFENAAGVTFPEFIEQGGSLQGALELMADDAESKGKRVTDSFGSIEAGMAATMLTSDAGREKMSENMDAMADRAGATEVAYEQMDQGIARTWERMTASLSSFFTELGERLGPGVTGILESALAGFNDFADKTLAFLDNIMSNWDGTWESIGVKTDGTVGQLLALAGSLWEGIAAAFDLIAAAWNDVLKPMWDAIAPFVDAALASTLAFVNSAVEIITAAFEGLAALMRGDFKGAWQAVEDIGESVMTALGTVVNAWWGATSGTFKKLVTFVNNQLDAAFGDLFSMADGAFTDIQGAATAWWTGLRGTFDRVKDYFGGAFEQGLSGTRDTLVTMFENFETSVTGSMETLFGAFGSIATGGMQSVRDAFQWMSGAVETIWENMTNAISTLAGGLGESVRNAFGSVVDWLIDRVNAVIDAINGMIDSLNRALEIEIPDIGFHIPNPIPGRSGWDVNVNTPNINPPDIPNIPHLATGGIVDSATLALIGEAGPEAVVPLDRLGSMGGGSQTIIVELDGQIIMRSVAPRLVDELRLKTGLAGL